MTEAKQLTLDDIIRIEPRIGVILRNINVNPRSPKRYAEYTNVKRQLMSLVGWSAENQKLCSSQAYDVVIDDVLVRLNLK